MIALTTLDPAAQAALPGEPYDRWLSPGGRATAEFHRHGAGYVVRFPGQADFAIDVRAMEVVCTPAGEERIGAAQSLFHNAIEPLVGNFAGGMFLHGSAVQVAGDHAIAFLGDSRRGKTTLAGGFARSGHPFLTEDTVKLEQSATGFRVAPTRPILRLFADSARHLLGDIPDERDGEGKNPVAAGDTLPFADAPAALGGIYLLGAGDSTSVDIAPLFAPAALTELMRHAFVLDVEDRARLRDHFRRIGELADQVPCFTLDFPRIYSHLPDVVEAIRAHALDNRRLHAN